MSSSPLPQNFQPGPYDVICALTKQARSHHGNTRFKNYIDDISSQYHHPTTSKVQKSKLLSQIISYVHEYGGSFVKYCKDNGGYWYQVNDQMARGKIGQCLRAKTNGLYRSCTTTKRLMRKEMNDRLETKVRLLLKSNAVVASEIHKLQDTINQYRHNIYETRGDNDDDDDDDLMFDDRDLELAMTDANIRVLDSLKRDYYDTMHKRQTATMNLDCEEVTMMICSSE